MAKPEQKKFTIRYTDKDDPGCPEFACTILAYDREHAEEKFLDDDDQGWRIISVKLAKTSS